MSASDDTDNAEHVRWLAETWQMIEQCAVSRDVSERVSLSPAVCAALRDERDCLRIALQLIEGMRCLHGKPENCACPCCIAGRALRFSAKGETT